MDHKDFCERGLQLQLQQILTFDDTAFIEISINYCTLKVKVEANVHRAISPRNMAE